MNTDSRYNFKDIENKWQKIWESKKTFLTAKIYTNQYLIKSREVDLKAMDTERKQQEMEQRKNIENAKLISREGIEDDKLEQNEDLAILRADTSLTKQHMSDVVKMDIANMKRKDVKTLKGPKR